MIDVPHIVHKMAIQYDIFFIHSIKVLCGELHSQDGLGLARRLQLREVIMMTFKTTEYYDEEDDDDDEGKPSVLDI